MLDIFFQHCVDIYSYCGCKGVNFFFLTRYVMGHIWACPPSEGDDYIFHCHPPDQKIPKPKRLVEWYRKMLDKAFAERILHDYKVRKHLCLCFYKNYSVLV